MLETLKAWLNGTREYYTGVAIYSQACTNEELLTVLKKGPNDFRVKRLQEELLAICNQLKAQKNDNCKYCPNSINILSDGSCHGNKLHPEKQNAGNIHNELVLQLPEKKEGPNPTLYAACKLKADQQYKKVMNDRAVLFSLAKTENFEDPNLPGKIQARVKLSLDVVHGYQLSSQLYDKADYVKLHGRLPDVGQDLDETAYDNLQDHLVKLRLDNARKAYNKLKAKETSPERIALMQTHEINIKKLETKWLSLKPVN